VQRRLLVRTAATGLGWACELFPLWFLFAGQWDVFTALWGAGASLLAGAGAAVVASRGLMPWGLRARWLGAVPSLLWQAAVDFGVITAVLARSVVRGRRDSVGSFVHRRTQSTGTDRRAAALRAWLTLAATYSPNAYVIDIDRATGQALLHDLRPMRASEEPL
jgi:hypothetical protein